MLARRPPVDQLLLTFLAIGALLAVAFASPAGAQIRFGPDPSRLWISVGGGHVWIPNEFQVKPGRPLFGGILGLRLAESLILEGRGCYARSPSEVPGGARISLAHGDGNLTWCLTKGSVQPFLTTGAGAVRMRSGDETENKFAYNAGGGFRVRIGERSHFRIEGRDVRYRVPRPTTGADDYRHSAQVYAGLSFGLGGRPSDRDGDGVRDGWDRCPDTPRGAVVDGAGCPLDGDVDGVFDGIDRCDGTPPGARVDAAGCPLDTDGDGVFDGLDACPDTPRGARVNAEGCAGDADGDGVPDGLDQCEGTQAGCVVNANGCAPDEDQDGVCDGLDRCPDTPAAMKVDPKGCPIQVRVRETEFIETGMIQLQDIQFETGRADLLPESYGPLDEVAEILLRWRDLRVEIAGHTDDRGSDSENLALSDARARAVRRYLVEAFPELDPARLTARGYGERVPIADNETELGRAKNRRVEFRVLNQDVLRREREEKGFAPKE